VCLSIDRQNEGNLKRLMGTNGTFILATVGTSLLNHLKRELRSDNVPRKKALSYVKGRQPTDPVLGAEINSIEHLVNGLKLTTGVTHPPFHLALLVSDTTDGQWTGELLKDYFSSVHRFKSVQWYTVEGLTPDDPTRFARVGLRSLVRESSRLLREAGNKSLFRVINATGGFKAQISFAGLIGQTLGIPVVYQFETFPVCVEMPPMPVDFDRECWLTHYDLFARLSERRAMTEDEFPFREVDPIIRELLDKCEEDGKSLYALSPILELMHQGFLVRRPRTSEEPPVSEITAQQKLSLVEHELPHDPKRTRDFAMALAKKFSWIIEIKNHTPRMNSQRTHLLPKKGDPSLHEVCYSDGEKGVRISIRTTCINEGHVAFVREALAWYLEHS
jgi:putative CRISPR-associated protein (TIGR02619 family)